MKEFTYTITDPVGIHARPAGLLVVQAKSLESTVTVIKSDGRSAAAADLMAIMTLSIRRGETVTVTVEGNIEEADVVAMEQFFKENL